MEVEWDVNKERVPLSFELYALPPFGRWVQIGYKDLTIFELCAQSSHYDLLLNWL